jgi:hypothetical protein
VSSCPSFAVSAWSDWLVIWSRASSKFSSAYGLSSAKITSSAPTAIASPTSARRNSARSLVRLAAEGEECVRCTRRPAATSTTSSTAPAVYFVAVATPIAAPASAQSVHAPRS